MRELWFTPADSAMLVGLKIRQFRDAIQPLIPPGGVRRTGQKLLFSGPALVAAAVQYRTPKIVEDDEAILAGSGDSPWLEKYREVKTRLAQKDLEERERTHANLKDLESAINRFANRIRSAGESLQRRFGADAADLLNEAIDDAVSGWLRDRQAEARARAETAQAGAAANEKSIPGNQDGGKLPAVKPAPKRSENPKRNDRRNGKRSGRAGRRGRKGTAGHRAKGAGAAPANHPPIRRAGDHPPDRTAQG